MCDPIVPDLDSARNPPTDLICPACRHTCAFSSAVRRVRCLACGWTVTLAPDEARDLVDALAGITTLPVPAYLHVLAQAAVVA